MVGGHPLTPPRSWTRSLTRPLPMPTMSYNPSQTKRAPSSGLPILFSHLSP